MNKSGFLDASDTSALSPNPSYRLLTGSNGNDGTLPFFEVLQETDEDLHDPHMVIIGSKFTLVEVSTEEVKQMVRRSGRFNYKIIQDPNCSNCVDWLSGLNVDLIVSYSAPCVFKRHLLEVPKYGCINLHCSLLPKYAGLLPSFWALYNQASSLGATVHRMDDKIDNGALLAQVEVPVPRNPTMFSVIKLTKRAGGLLMVSVINDILTDSLDEKENLVREGDYFSWPSVEQINDFRTNGGRLI